MCEVKNKKIAMETNEIFLLLMTKMSLLAAKYKTDFLGFNSGNILLRDEPRPGRSSDLSQDLIRELVECNQLKRTRELARHEHITIYNVPTLKRKMGKLSKLGVWLPHTLNEKYIHSEKFSFKERINCFSNMSI